MSGSRLSQVYRIVFTALVVIYVAAGIFGGVFIDFDNGGDRAFWIGFLLGGAALMVLGQFVRVTSAWLPAVAVAVGAVLGALPLFWTILVPVAAAAIVALSVARARVSPA